MQTQHLAAECVTHMVRPDVLRPHVEQTRSPSAVPVCLGCQNALARGIEDSSRRLAMADLDRLVLVVPETKEALAERIQAAILAQPGDKSDPDVSVTGVKGDLALVGEQVDEVTQPAVAPFTIAR